MPLLLALLLLTFAKPLPLRGPPKRCPPPPASWRCLGDPAYLMVKRGLCVKVLILPGESVLGLLAAVTPQRPARGLAGSPSTRDSLSSRKPPPQRSTAIVRKLLSAFWG